MSQGNQTAITDNWNESTDKKSTGNALQPVSRYARECTSDGEDSSDTETVETAKQESSDTALETDWITQECPDCGGQIQEEGGEQYCGDCGTVVVQETIDTGPEWRSFTDEERKSKSRTGRPRTQTLHDNGLSTVIGNGFTDNNGNRLSSSQQNRAKRLRRCAQWNNMSGKERSLAQGLGEIKRLCSKLEVGNFVKEGASKLYRTASEDNLLEGRSIEGVATASVYITLRQAKLPFTLSQVTEYARVEHTEVARTNRYLQRNLELEVKPPEVWEYLNRVVSELGITQQTQEEAEELVEIAIDRNIHSGRSPASVAAGAIYAASIITQRDRVTQRELCDVFDLTAVTVRKRYRELLEVKGFDPENHTAPSKKKAENITAEAT